jgi:beta-glucosidase
VKLEDSPAFALDNYVKTTGNTDVFAGLVADKEAGADGTGAAKGEKDPDTARYSEGFLVGYRWFDTKGIEVAYPFGFGLTYTSFSYADLKTEKDTYGNKDVIRLSFELVNSGSVAADEVPQVYVHRINPGVEWPYKELKAFSRVTLQPGETKRVTMEIPVKNLRYWDEKSHAWTDDLCEIELQVGASAGDILLSKRVQLK